MKTLVLASLFVALGAGSWGVLSTTPHFAFKKWDGKIQTIVREALATVGVNDKQIISSLNEIHKESDGDEWVVHSLELGKLSAAKAAELKGLLTKMGASVEEAKQDGKTLLLVKRDARLYQKIRFTPAP